MRGNGDGGDNRGGEGGRIAGAGVNTEMSFILLPATNRKLKLLCVRGYINTCTYVCVCA